MTYAEVVLDRPTPEPFTYQITAEHLPETVPGSLVEVPFGRKTVYGVVSALRRRVPPDLAEKLRPLNRVLSTGPWAPPTTLALARAMARYSGESLGICLFRLLPPPGKRLNVSVQSVARPRVDTAASQRFHLYGGGTYRTAQYRALTSKTLGHGRQVLVIAPLHRIPDLARALAPLGMVQTMSADSPPTAQRRVADAWRRGTCQILIGTRHLIGWPADQLGLLVVDDPLHQAHADDQRPYLDSTTIALLRARADRCHILLGSAIPTLGLGAVEAQGGARRLRGEPTPTSLYLIQHAGSSWPAPSILEAIQTGQPTQIIAPRTGTGGTLRCETCDTAVACTVCEGELELTSTPQQARCFQCGAIGPWPDNCLQCHGQQLRLTGVGIEAIRRDLIRALGTLPAHVTIGTEQLLDEPAEQVILPFADSPIAAPAVGRTTRYVNRIREAMSRSHAVFLLTNHPESDWWRLLGENAHLGLQSLLTERQTAHLPPFVRRLELEGVSTEALPALPSTVHLSPFHRDGHAMIEVLIPAPLWGQVLTLLTSARIRGLSIKVDSLLDQQ